MAVTFDGSNNYIDTGSWSVSGNQLTIMGWCKWVTTPTDPRIISKSNTVNNQPWCLLVNGGNDTFAFRIYNPSSTIITSTFSGVAGTWYHVCGTYDGATMRLYIDGVENNSGAKTGNLTVNATPVWLGGNGTVATQRPWHGDLEDLRVYDRCLSAKEVKNIYYSQGRDDIVDGLQARWTLTEFSSGYTIPSTAGLIKDASNNNRNGTAYGPNSSENKLVYGRRQI